MKKLLLLLLLALALGAGALGLSFTAEKLPVSETYAFVRPEANPPQSMKVSALSTGSMASKAVLAVRGGALDQDATFAMSGLLIEHPQGNLLIDAGFGRNVDQHFLTTPKLMQLTSTYSKGTAIADQLSKAHIKLNGIVLTHAHWDHVSGVEDLSGVPVWIPQPELDFAQSGDPAGRLLNSFADVSYKIYAFDNTPYLGFEQSLDVHGDGSVVIVPAAGHTPGSVIVFVNTPERQHYALIGDLVWLKEGVDWPAERPWLPRKMVDWNEQKVRRLIVHLHQLQKAFPDLVIVPAHDQRIWLKLPRMSAGDSRGRKLAQLEGDGAQN